ncbi:MAG: NAD(P)-binding domain-containing protein, partial [Stellaceae bacterium]
MTQAAIATPKRIGIVGLGAMGRPMARHLLAKGFSVAGCDISDAARERAAALGVAIAPNP